MKRLGTGGARAMSGMSLRVWRRLALMGLWRSVAGEALARACVPVGPDERGGLVLVAVDERWAREIALNEQLLRDGLHRATGERVSRLVVRVDPVLFSDSQGAISTSQHEARTLLGREHSETALEGVGASTPLLQRLEDLRDRYLAAAARRAGTPVDPSP